MMPSRSPFPKVSRWWVSTSLVVWAMATPPRLWVAHSVRSHDLPQKMPRCWRADAECGRRRRGKVSRAACCASSLVRAYEGGRLIELAVSREIRDAILVEIVARERQM